MQIRRRIVCEEGDVFDEAEQRVAQPCDSMKDGPFCRGLPFSSSVPRHRPFTVDSIVPQHLFGDGVAMASGEGDGQSAEYRQATHTLNQFLEEYYNPQKGLARISPIEGRLEIGAADPAWTSRDLPFVFSRGLPEGVLATWEGAWQALPAVEGADPSGRSSSAVRLNSAVGTIRFSRPVVVRHLVVRPPLHASPGESSDGSHAGYRLNVRARKAGTEAWRSAYVFGGPSSETPPSNCGIGDLVAARWAGDGRRYLAVVIEAHNVSATLGWLDNDHTHRLVRWSRINSADGSPCRGGQASGIGGTDASNGQEATRSKASMRHGPLWRDLARRVKTVDEISFSVPFGSEGWLIGEVAIAAVKAPAQEAESADGATSAQSNDPSSHMVQVYPGPWAQIVKVSSAAVIYNADDMLERGLRLHGVRAGPRQAQVSKDVSHEDSASAEAKGDESARLKLSTSRSVEGLRQLLRALADFGADRPPMVRLPAHLSQEQFLEDAERLAVALDANKAEVKKYGHFEAFFAIRWDFVTPADALQVAFERWRRAPETQQEAQNSFFEGQTWTGAYFCTQGPTSLTLAVTKVLDGSTGQASIEADLSFKLKGQKMGGKGGVDLEPVQGSYSVVGRIEAEGRALQLEPIAGSWKNKPKNFVMVGLQGVVSRGAERGFLRYAGSIPIFGCDSFELTAKRPDDAPPDPSPASKTALSRLEPASHHRALWNSALARLAESLTAAQKRWRLELQAIIVEKGSSASDGADSKQAKTVAQLVEAARSAGLMSLEVTTADGEQFTVKIGDR